MNERVQPSFSFHKAVSAPPESALPRGAEILDLPDDELETDMWTTGTQGVLEQDPLAALQLTLQGSPS